VLGESQVEVEGLVHLRWVAHKHLGAGQEGRVLGQNDLAVVGALSLKDALDVPQRQGYTADCVAGGGRQQDRVDGLVHISELSRVRQDLLQGRQQPLDHGRLRLEAEGVAGDEELREGDGGRLTARTTARSLDDGKHRLVQRLLALGERRQDLLHSCTSHTDSIVFFEVDEVAELVEELVHIWVGVRRGLVQLLGDGFQLTHQR